MVSFLNYNFSFILYKLYRKCIIYIYSCAHKFTLSFHYNYFVLWTICKYILREIQYKYKSVMIIQGNFLNYPNLVFGVCQFLQFHAFMMLLFMKTLIHESVDSFTESNSCQVLLFELHEGYDQ